MERSEKSDLKWEIVAGATLLDSSLRCAALRMTVGGDDGGDVGVGIGFESLFLRNTPVIQVGVALGSCAKAQGLLLADIAVGLFLMPSPPASAGAGSSSLRGRGDKRKAPPSRGRDNMKERRYLGRN